MEDTGYACYRGRPLAIWCGDCRQRRPERRRGERRQGRRRFCWPEKRSGFDNRQPSIMLGSLRRAAFAMHNDSGLLVKILLLFNIYNLADYLLTTRALAAGHREINPIMGSLFAVDPLLAGGVKIGCGLLVTMLIWRFRRFRLILQFSLFVVGLYLALIAYQLYGVFHG